MGLLRILAFLAFLLAALAAFGWLLEQSTGRALGLACIGLACYVASAFEPPRVPPSR